MDRFELLSILEELISDAKVGVLSTVDAQGRPHARWMTPALLPARPGSIYTVSTPDAPKISQLAARPEVEWMFQTRAVHRVVNVRGRCYVVEAPQLRAEVLEAIGRKLAAFWRYNQDPASLVILETVMEEACYYLPMKGQMVTCRLVED